MSEVKNGKKEKKTRFKKSTQKNEAGSIVIVWWDWQQGSISEKSKAMVAA
ncbi:MAG: hypothetical protein ACE5EY_12660 [Anaerolineae bacterium]